MKNLPESNNEKKNLFSVVTSELTGRRLECRSTALTLDQTDASLLTLHAVPLRCLTSLEPVVLQEVVFQGSQNLKKMAISMKTLTTCDMG